MNTDHVDTYRVLFTTYRLALEESYAWQHGEIVEHDLDADLESGLERQAQGLCLQQR